MPNHIYQPNTGDDIATGTQRDALRLSRAPLSTGRPRGWQIYLEMDTGHLTWYRAVREGFDLCGYVSAQWVGECTVGKMT